MESLHMFRSFLLAYHTLSSRPLNLRSGLYVDAHKHHPKLLSQQTPRQKTNPLVVHASNNNTYQADIAVLAPSPLGYACLHHDALFFQIDLVLVLAYSHCPFLSPCDFCNRVIYCLETVFHISIYFSVHCVKHVSSLLLRPVPGEGMHFSKQCMLSF